MAAEKFAEALYFGGHRQKLGLCCRLDLFRAPRPLNLGILIADGALSISSPGGDLEKIIPLHRRRADAAHDRVYLRFGGPDGSVDLAVFVVERDDAAHAPDAFLTDDKAVLILQVVGSDDIAGEGRFSLMKTLS